MTLPMAAETVPLSTDPEGLVRVKKTRVTLDTIVYAFRKGASAEEISDRYLLELADVYATIAYFLRFQAAVDEYLKFRENASSKVRQENEVRFPPHGIRQRLMDRHAD